MSIEALAMAGVDYKECQINLEDMEDEEATPQYLLADDGDDDHNHQFNYLFYKNTIIKKSKSSAIRYHPDVNDLQQ